MAQTDPHKSAQPTQTPNVSVVPVPIQANVVNCPPGLEYLQAVDQLILKQKIELLEVLIGFETNNQYEIKNNLGQQVFVAAEQTDCCTRNCCGPTRPFQMRVIDNFQREVIHIHRPLRCDSCLCFCCLQHVRVESPPGQCIGYVIQDCSCLRPLFHLESPTGEKWLRIRGPICTCSMFCNDVIFKVLAKDSDVEVGRISKHWSGLLREGFTDADNFGVSFPVDLNVRVKACLLAATFLIDYMFFESNK